MSSIEIAEARARKSDDPQLFMLAYSAGWNTAAEGGDVTTYARSLVDPTADAGFIEGATAYRARHAKPRDYLPNRPARTHTNRGTRNA